MQMTFFVMITSAVGFFLATSNDSNESLCLLCESSDMMFLDKAARITY